MTAVSIWQKIHRDFSLSTTTWIMDMYDILKVIKLVQQSTREYLTEIQITCDSLASCEHPIKEIQQISIILNEVKGQFNNVIVVIHTSRNPYDIVSVSFVLLDIEARQSDLLFDNSVSANVYANTSSSCNPQDFDNFAPKNYSSHISFGLLPHPSSHH